MTSTQLTQFMNREPVEIKNVLTFNKEVLLDRLKTFYRFEKDLEVLSHDEVKQWMSIFKLNSIQKVNIESQVKNPDNVIESDRFRLFKYIELAFAKSSSFTYGGDKGRIIGDYSVKKIEPLEVIPISFMIKQNEKKLSKKDLLKLK